MKGLPGRFDIRTAGFVLLVCAMTSGLIACNPNRNPEDADTNLVGIFDPGDLQLPVVVLLELRLENQVIGVDPIRLTMKSILAEAVLADVALFDYPKEGTCEVYDEIVGRAVVVPTNIMDGGEALELSNDDTAITIERETDLNPAVNPGFYQSLDTAQNCIGLPSDQLCLPAESPFMENTLFDFIVPGGPSLPAGNFPEVLLTPMDYTLEAPDLATEIVVSLPNPADIQLQWDPPSNTSDAFTVRIVKPDRSKLLYCRAADTGTFTIPGSRLAELSTGRYIFMASRTRESFFRLIPEHRTLASSSVDWAGFLKVE